MERWDICVASARSDAPSAQMLAESIRKYRLPSGVVTASPDKDYRRILLDTEETPCDSQVQTKLENCRFFVFLCSPDAKSSEALKERLAAFRSTHGSENVIAVLVRGEPEDSFPENFREQKLVRHILPDQRVLERMETIEPIAADLRADTEKRRRQLLRYETVRIVASVMSLHPDDLEQRQHARPTVLR